MSVLRGLAHTLTWHTCLPRPTASHQLVMEVQLRRTNKAVVADQGSHSQSWLLVWACILCTLVTLSCAVVWLAWRAGQVLSRRVRLAWQRAMSTGAWLRQDVRDQGQEFRERGPQRQQAHQGRGPRAQDLHPATEEGADPTASKRPRTERKSQDTPDFNALPLVRPGLHLHAEKNRVGGAESQRHHYLREQECRGPLRTAGASLRWGAHANNPRLPVQWRRPCLVVGQRRAEAASQRPFRTPVSVGALYPHGGVRSRDHLSWQAALLLGFPVRRRSVGHHSAEHRLKGLRKTSRRFGAPADLEGYRQVQDRGYFSANHSCSSQTSCAAFTAGNDPAQLLGLDTWRRPSGSECLEAQKRCRRLFCHVEYNVRLAPRKGRTLCPFTHQKCGKMQEVLDAGSRQASGVKVDCKASFGMRGARMHLTATGQKGTSAVQLGWRCGHGQILHV